jgi:hypothetical protein
VDSNVLDDALLSKGHAAEQHDDQTEAKQLEQPACNGAA